MSNVGCIVEGCAARDGTDDPFCANCYDLWVRPYLADLTAERARLARALEVLRRVEDAGRGGDYDNGCPECGGDTWTGGVRHKKDCELAALLAGR